MTALHVAACEGHSDFVEKLAQLMPVEALEMVDEFGRTALHYAAFSGILKAAIAQVKKNPNLTSILDSQGWTPLLRACVFGFAINKDLIWYLFLVTKDDGPGRPFTGPCSPYLVETLAGSGHLDILLYLLEHYPDLATAPITDKPPRIYLLSLLALTPLNFLSCSRLGFWERLIYSSPSIIKRLQDAKIRHHCADELVTLACKKICELHGSLLFDRFGESLILESAANSGITEIVKTMLHFCPDLLWATKADELFMLHVAIEHRQEEIFNLLCKTNAHLKFTSGQNTLLHRVAKLAPLPQLSVSSPALQMQRELQWFRAVEKLINPCLTNLKDKDGRTPREIFTKEHKTLAEAGEKWMKDTSNSCMIVSTLIATFVFAAAFTVPGGNDEAGLPIFLWTQSFLVFVVSDALALFSSITSLLIFFSILTARYAEDDFHMLLPKKLIIGLASLFFSIATMMVAFGATLLIVLSKRVDWVAIPIILLASVPVSIFVLLQFPLFIEMYRSTFGNRMFHPQSIW
ncbi:ankyrin repeat-containing protein NPR4 [Morus notabilis]|uniref:ankyrin repeat-containing protein NPR4 n=1 Tax=Morus notabilis TaxID=981085 RepID=UPI000CED2F72|nr:ankyrin repeat-containing protein NPR4 [Morus notabilis]